MWQSLTRKVTFTHVVKLHSYSAHIKEHMHLKDLQSVSRTRRNTYTVLIHSIHAWLFSNTHTDTHRTYRLESECLPAWYQTRCRGWSSWSAEEACIPRQQMSHPSAVRRKEKNKRDKWREDKKEKPILAVTSNFFDWIFIPGHKLIFVSWWYKPHS